MTGVVVQQRLMAGTNGPRLRKAAIEFRGFREFPEVQSVHGSAVGALHVFSFCACAVKQYAARVRSLRKWAETVMQGGRGEGVQSRWSKWRNAGTASPSPLSASNGVVLATEKKQKSILYDERSVHKVESITKHIGLVYSGMGPDYRVLVHRARKLAQQYYLVYHEPIPTAQLVQRIASVMQEYTQSGGVRPFGVSLLICGWNEGRPYLFQSDPSGAYFAWKATAMGKNYVNGKTFLEKRYNEDLELEDAIHTAILTLKESFEGQMTEDNIEVGICNEAGFRRLTPTEVKDYLAAIA
uniref:Proteasome subunit alpha type-2 n=1 Tax=Podarcis muralis TaxID=64176 RepID=A0A670JMX4_PODMU